MPLTQKNQQDIRYRARLDGLRVQEFLALADQIRQLLDLSAEQSIGVTFDLPSSKFDGTLEEARTVFQAGKDEELVSNAAFHINGQADTRKKIVKVESSAFYGNVSLTFGLTIEPAEMDEVIQLTKQALPPMFPDSDAEQQRLRSVRVACEEMAANAASVKEACTVVTQQANVVSQLAAEVDEARGAIGANAKEATVLLETATQRHASLVELLDRAKVINQDIEDKQVRFTGIVNNAEDFQRRIEAAEQKARTVVEEVQTKTAASLQELHTKSGTTIADLQTENGALTTRLQSANEASVTEMQAEIARQLKGHGERTDAIVTRNEGLQADVKTLLQGATAGQLHLAFKERQKELESTQGRWLTGLVVNTVMIVVGGMWLINDLAQVQGTELGLIAVKVTVILPLVILDFFVGSQYTHRGALIEEYAFKASICASLMPFKDLVLGQAGQDSTQRFVLDAVERIYTNPSDAITRAGPATKQVRSAMKILQDTGVLDLAKAAVDKAKP